MEHRKLGTSGIDVSVISLGTAAMGGDLAAWGRVDDNESVAAIHRALELGVNLIDTSPAYGEGHSEEIVGKAVRDRRESVRLATTCSSGPVQTPRNSISQENARDRIIHDCDVSLRRLQTDYIDLYQCSWPEPGRATAETMMALTTLLEQGKIRAVRLAHSSCDEIAAALEYGPIHALQVPLSLCRRRAIADLLPFCVEHDIAVLACGTLAKGLLTGKFEPGTPISGVRAMDPEFMGTRYGRNLERVRKLSGIAARHDKTLAQLAIQWALVQPGISSVVVGAKRPSQVAEDVGGAGRRLEPDDLAAIETLFAGT